MPIQEVAPATLSEIQEAIDGFEKFYGVSSSFFKEWGRQHSGEYVPDDDSGEWSYLLLQRRALKSDESSALQAAQAGLGEGSFESYGDLLVEEEEPVGAGAQIRSASSVSTTVPPIRYVRIQDVFKFLNPDPRASYDCAA